MRLLIDINVLLDAALLRPGASASARLLRLCGRQHEAWLAWSRASWSRLIKRNIARFADDFMFQLSTEEFANLKSQIVISS